MKDKTKLAVIDGETLMDMRLVPTKFCVDTLLPQGICILGGAPKIGKSWLVLDLCVRIAKGEPIWNLQTHKGTVLYLCLEDTLRRVQERLNCITDEVPKEVFFATTAHTLAEGLCDDVRSFVKEHSDTVFVAIDTFQVIRSYTADTSYANDYDELRKLKKLADELRRVGNNLNQITRAVNAGMIPAVDLNETREELKKIWQSLNSLPRAVR